MAYSSLIRSSTPTDVSPPAYLFRPSGQSKSSVTVLPLNGLGSSIGVANVNNSAIWGLHKPPLQLPWIPRHYPRHGCYGNAHDFVLPPDTPSRKGCDAHDFAPRYDVPVKNGDMVLRYGTPSDLRGAGDYVIRLVPPPRVGSKAYDSAHRYDYRRFSDYAIRYFTPIKGSDGHYWEGSFLSRKAASYVNGSLVRLAFHQDGNILTVLTGTIICSDGIIATSASCLSFLKGKELQKVKVDVEHPVKQKIYKGVLLDAGFGSNIVFVKITSSVYLAPTVFGNLDHLLSGSSVVVASCSTQGSFDVIRLRHTGPTDWAKPNFVVGSFSCVAYEEENNELHNARTFGQIIKAAVSNTLDTAVGGCLVDPRRGVVGIIHKANPHNAQIEATPIDLVVKYLMHSEEASFTRMYIDEVSWIIKAAPSGGFLP